MKYEILKTGSKGNGLIINDVILVDCGIPYKMLQGRAIDLTMLTHSHGDHFNHRTLCNLAADSPLMRVAIPGTMFEETIIRAQVSDRQVDICHPYVWNKYNERLKVMAFDIPHDVHNVGWLIEMDGERAFYATDCGTLDGLFGEAFANCDYYFIEANYDEEDLERRIEEKLQAGFFAYETRVKNTHLSRQQAEAWLADHASPESKIIYLHQHEDRIDG